MTPLAQKQRNFPLMVASLVSWAYEHGFELSLGEAYRSDEQSEINALGPALRVRLADLIATQFPDLAAKIRNNEGSGIRTSLHGERIAIDLNLFINGVYQTQTEAYRPLGEQWEAIGGTWGGRFSSTRRRKSFLHRT
jgi:hypothetical protein